MGLELPAPASKTIDLEGRLVTVEHPAKRSFAESTTSQFLSAGSAGELQYCAEPKDLGDPIQS